jgi:5-hydroxyisourate hydrolase-like protein (transthyretin family)
VDNQPISNARVYLTAMTNSDISNSEGGYIFSGLLPGRYRIVVEADGYQRIEAYVDIEEGVDQVFERQLIIDEDVTGLSGTVQGYITDSTTGNPIENVSIDIFSGMRNLNEDDFLKTVTTGSTGEYQLELESGSYTAKITKDGYITQVVTITAVGDSSRDYSFVVSEALGESQARIVLDWGDQPRDLDSHLVKLDSNGNLLYHIAYDSKTAENGDNLDIDDVDGEGPETVTIQELDSNSTYIYYVHHYSGSKEIRTSNAQVSLNIGDKQYNFYPPNESGIYWKVFTIENGAIKGCTTNCMGDVESEVDGIMSYGSSNQADKFNEKELFKNLPQK